MKDEHDAGALGLDDLGTVIVELSRLLTRYRAEGRPGPAGLIRAAHAYLIRAGRMLDGRLQDEVSHARLRRLGEMIRHQDPLDYLEYIEALRGAGFVDIDVHNLDVSTRLARALEANGYVTCIEFETLKSGHEKVTRVGRIWPKREVYTQEKTS